ncbi:unnamed protein product [Ceutorhynchus assimilis]|uniref:Uncharacterized protein n=1 Tax=Ceutorhynchus assimilis TaxID=467358 RepID=A0A9N9QMU0_9CUCU|nr:unnamed protein product [Ceutorhynchus assimilis]
MSAKSKLILQLALNQEINEYNNFSDDDDDEDSLTYATLTPVPIPDTYSRNVSNSTDSSDYLRVTNPNSSQEEIPDKSSIITSKEPFSNEKPLNEGIPYAEPSSSYVESDTRIDVEDGNFGFTDSEDSYEPSSDDGESSESEELTREPRRERDLEVASNGGKPTQENAELRRESDSDVDINAAEPVQENATKKLTRKRKRDPNSWKRNVQKNLRLEGKQYYTQKGKLKGAKSVKDIVSRCHYKCQQYFTKSLNGILLLFQKKRCYSENNDRRSKTFVYHLTSNQALRQVCQKNFLATLNISSRTVRTAVSKSSETGIIKPDLRGKKSPPQKNPENVKNVIREHIKSIPVVSSHYCRTTTKRNHLPPNLSEKRLYEDYKLSCEDRDVVPEKFSITRNVFVTEFNLGFHRPKKDRCDLCTKFSSLEEQEKFPLQEEYDLHLIRKQEARDHKKDDKERSKVNNSFASYTMDMEKVLVTPSLNVGKLYYAQKLKTYNFTVYNLATSEATNYIWHEGVGTKGSAEIATCLWHVLHNLDPFVKDIIFYSDTASGQNRNCINAAMFLKAVSELPVEVVNQKFMESGHSEMDATVLILALRLGAIKLIFYA